jgi:hypothetical protein
MLHNNGKAVTVRTHCCTTMVSDHISARVPTVETQYTKWEEATVGTHYCTKALYHISIRMTRDTIMTVDHISARTTFDTTISYHISAIITYMMWHE